MQKNWMKMSRGMKYRFSQILHLHLLLHEESITVVVLDLKFYMRTAFLPI